MKANEIIEKYINFFKAQGHIQIQNSSLVPENDPTTLFTSSGMQPLVPYLLGESHPQGKRLVNVQNCFRAQDIDEIGDNRHTTFFRMLGNWSLGDYFREEQLPWFFEFLTEQLNIDPARLYVSIFKGYKDIGKDTASENIWRELFASKNVNPEGRIFEYGVDENWWSRAGEPDNMPVGEPGGTDSEVFFDFYPDQKFEKDLKIYSHDGRLLEIGNSVFMQYKKTASGFEELPQKNVDFGGGVERLVAATEDEQDIFKTSTFKKIVDTIEETISGTNYEDHKTEMRIVTDHFISSIFIAASGIRPSNKDQGYVLRRFIRRGLDNLYDLREGAGIDPILDSIFLEYQKTDPWITDHFAEVKSVILEEEGKYSQTRKKARAFIEKKYQSKQVGGEILGVTEISSDDAFALYTTHGLSPTQIKSLGYVFNDQEFANKMEEHQKLSRSGAQQKFAGGLADNEELTVKGHTATHLMHQALRDVLGDQVHQTGSNITTERVRFDFNYDKKLTDEETKKVEEIVRQKISENLPVRFEIMPLARAKEIGAIGLFDEKYQKDVKVYFVGDYSKEFCGGPHVNFTGEIKSFKIIKEESLGKTNRRIYAVVE